MLLRRSFATVQELALTKTSELQQSIQLEAFRLEVAQLEEWLEEQQLLLEDAQLGRSLDEVAALIKRHGTSEPCVFMFIFSTHHLYRVV